MLVANSHLAMELFSYRSQPVNRKTFDYLNMDILSKFVVVMIHGAFHTHIHTHVLDSLLLIVQHIVHYNFNKIVKRYHEN